MMSQLPRAFSATVAAALFSSSCFISVGVAADGDVVVSPPVEPVIKIGPSPFGDPLPAADGSGRQEWFQRQRPNFVAPSFDRKSKPGSVVFFPPAPPRFDELAADPDPATRFETGQVPAPSRLTEYVGEIFYPALGTRLLDRTLSARLESRLASYRQTRNDLVAELLREFAAVANAAPAARESALIAFAAKQNPRLAALEAESEQLRKALLRRGFLEASVDWNSSRRWKLGDRSIPAALATEAEFQVVRAAAFELGGLSVAQRGLLRELTLELGERVPGETAASPAHGLFFSPETAWLALPAHLPPELRAQLAAYRQDRDNLKQPLRKLIAELDAAPEAIRTQTLAVLTERQQPMLAALERRADDIRRKLAALPEFSLSLPRVPLPPDLAQRISALHRERLALHLERRQAIGTVENSPPPFFEEPEYGSRERAWQKPPANENAARIENAAKDFDEKNRERYTALSRLEQSIRSDLAELARQSSPSAREPLNPDSLLREFEAAESTPPLTYRLALLQPGLSPEQRRLLLNAALIELAPSLPAGETKPTFPLPVPPS